MAGNTSLQLGSTASLFLVSFTSLQIIIGSLSNGFVIVTFLASRELRRRPSDLFILNLAVADLIFLTTFLPWLTRVVYQKAVITFEAEYYVYESLGCFVNLSSKHAIMLIAIDRLIAVVLPLRYETLATRKGIYILIIISWTFALLIGLVNYFAYILKFYLKFLSFWTFFIVGSSVWHNPYLHHHLYYNSEKEQKIIRTERSFSLTKRAYSISHSV